MSYTNSRSMILFSVFFFCFYFIVWTVNQFVLGNNPTITLFQNILAGSVLGVLALKAWQRYKKTIGNIAKDKIVHLIDPATGVTVLAFLAFTTILNAVDRYYDMGLAHLITMLTIGPLVVALVSGNIPFTFWKKRGDWRTR